MSGDCAGTKFHGIEDELEEGNEAGPLAKKQLFLVR